MDQRVELDADLALAGVADLVVMHVYFDAGFKQGQDHLRA